MNATDPSSGPASASPRSFRQARPAGFGKLPLHAVLIEAFHLIALHEPQETETFHQDRERRVGLPGANSGIASQVCHDLSHDEPNQGGEKQEADGEPEVQQQDQNQ